jgi:hypothetical protein
LGEGDETMPDRQSRHPDNDLIDQAQQDSMPNAQQSRAGGGVSGEVGTRAELNAAQGQLEGEEVERATGSDNPEQDARKCDKSIDHMVGGGSSPSR